MLIRILVAKNQLLPRHIDVAIKSDRLILNERTSKGGYPKGRSTKMIRPKITLNSLLDKTLINKGNPNTLQKRVFASKF